MALSGGGNNNYKLETLETEVEIKSNADKLYKVFSNQHHAFPNASSDHVHDVVVHEGDWETSGSIKLWTYTVGNKSNRDVMTPTHMLTLLFNSQFFKLYNFYCVYSLQMKYLVGMYFFFFAIFMV